MSINLLQHHNNSLFLIKYLSFFVLFSLTSCKNSYSGNAQKIEKILEELNNKSSYSKLHITCDSIEIMVLSNPTLMKLEFDTIIEQTIDEQDFIIIEYSRGKRLLQIVEADDLKYQNLSFEDLKFMRNDTILIQRINCIDNDEKWKCNIVFKKL